MAVSHDALHQFSAGVNASNNTSPVLFDHPIQQGWKVYYEGYNDSIVRVDDAVVPPASTHADDT